MRAPDFLRVVFPVFVGEACFFAVVRVIGGVGGCGIRSFARCCMVVWRRAESQGSGCWRGGVRSCWLFYYGAVLENVLVCCTVCPCVLEEMQE